MNKRKDKIWMLFCVLLLFLASCNPKQPLNADQISILNDDSCSPPCWKGITPGKTTREETGFIIQSIPWIEKTSIKDISTTTHEDVIKWMTKSGTDEISGRVYISNEVVSVIEINLDSNNTKFSNMVTKFGDPEYVIIYRTMVEKSIMTILILYPQKGLAFLDYYYTPLEPISKTISISPTDDVLCIWYFNPELYPAIFTSGPIYRIGTAFFDKEVQTWNGYGEYEWIMNNP